MKKFELSFILINVYSPTSTQDKQKLWLDLTQIIQIHSDQYIILGGDFNAILKMTKKNGGIYPPLKIIQDLEREISCWTLSLLMVSSHGLSRL